jgi:hypothetical protein
MQADAWISTAEVAWREPFGVAETPAEYVFLRPRLYLDTSIPSYLTALMSRDLRVARLQRITLRWWNSWRTNFDIYISDHVSEEAARGDPEAARRRLQLLVPLKTLDDDDHSSLLHERIMKECGLPPRASTDAAHVAVASVHGMQYLLTWNHAHLVNPVFAPRITAVCESLGYQCPILCTPEQLLERYEHGQTEALPSTR